MKNFFLIFAFLPVFCAAQFGTIKVAFMGNSYCNGCCVPVVGSDRPEAYRYLVKTRLGLYYDNVVEVKLCLGGEDITDAMPDWYPGTIPARNIDAALDSAPDLILIEYAGNHFADLVNYDTILYCYNYIADTLKGLGQRFIFTSSMPRKTTFDAPLTYVEYQDTAQMFNAWLYENYPLDNVNVFTDLYDPVINKPVFGYLGSDSLHWNATGYAIIADDLFQAAVIDTLTAFERPRLIDVRMYDMGDSILIQANALRTKSLAVNTSADGVTFTEQWASGTGYNTDNSITVAKNNFVQLVAINNEHIVKHTRQFLAP